MTPEEIKAKAAVVKELQDLNKAIKSVKDIIGWGTIWLFFIALNTCGVGNIG